MIGKRKSTSSVAVGGFGGAVLGFGTGLAWAFRQLAFTRAFGKAFGVSPSLHRRMGATYTHLHRANGIHHHSGTDDCNV